MNIFLDRVADSRAQKILWLFALLLLCLSVYMQWVSGLTGDKGWLLLAARMMLSGKKLYVDVVESNPPFIVWFYAIAVYLSGLIGIRDYHLLVALGLAITGLSIFFSWRLMRSHPAFTHDLHKQALFILLLVFVFRVNPLYFFDRDHIVLVLTLPYVWRLMPSLSAVTLTQRQRVLIGLMAGIGFCFKPHALVICIGLQLIYVLREQTLRMLWSIENIFIYLCMLLYLLAAWRITPDYFTSVLPMLRATYGGFHDRRGGLVYMAGAVFITAVTFIDFRLRDDSPYRKDIFYLLGVSAFWLCYVGINNGWGYTYNPLISMLLVTTGFVFWERLYLKKENAGKGLSVKPFMQGIYACLFVFAAVTTLSLLEFALAFSYDCNDIKGCKSDQDIIDTIRDSHTRSFGAMIMNYHLIPMIYLESGAQLATRFNHFWMLPKIVMADTAEQPRYQWIVAYVSHSLAEDLNRNKPPLVLVDTSPQFYHTSKEINLIRYFSQYPDFKDAWSHYRLQKRWDHCKRTTPEETPPGMCQYSLYERTPDR